VGRKRIAGGCRAGKGIADRLQGRGKSPGLVDLVDEQQMAALLEKCLKQVIDALESILEQKQDVLKLILDKERENTKYGGQNSINSAKFMEHGARMPKVSTAAGSGFSSILFT